MGLKKATLLDEAAVKSTGRVNEVRTGESPTPASLIKVWPLYSV